MRRRTLVKIGCIAALCAAIVPPLLRENAHAEPVTVLTPKKEVRWADFLGVNAHFLWFEPSVYQRQIERLKALGLNWVRIDLHWDQHEPQEGKYRLGMVDALMDEVAKENLRALVYMVGSAPFASSAPSGAEFHDQYPPKDPAVFADRMAMLAKRYPQVAAWQVWNEPNIPSFWRPHEDAAGYGRLLQASFQALKSAAPQKPVVIGGMAYYSQMPVKKGLMLEELGKNGAFNLGAVVAYHPYSEFPEGDNPREQDFIARTSMGNTRLRTAGVKQIWATEWGWSSYAGPKEMQALIGESGQADFLLRRLALMSTQDFDKVFLFALSDLDSRASVRDQSYGLLTRDAMPKPSYLALERFLKIMGPQVTPTAPVDAKADDRGLYSITWQSGQRKLWLFWGAQATTASLPDTKKGVLYDPLNGDIRMLAAQQGTLRVPVKTSLQILELG